MGQHGAEGYLKGMLLSDNFARNFFAGVTLQVGKDPISALGLDRADLLGKEIFVVHVLFPSEFHSLVGGPWLGVVRLCRVDRRKTSQAKEKEGPPPGEPGGGQISEQAKVKGKPRHRALGGPSSKSASRSRNPVGSPPELPQRSRRKRVRDSPSRRWAVITST